MAAFGLGSSTIGIALLSTGASYTSGIMNVAPQAYGSGNYELVGCYANRMMILATIIFTPIILLIQFIYYPFVWMTGNE